MGRRNQNRLATSSEPTDVDGILARHAASLREPSGRWIYDWDLDQRIFVPDREPQAEPFNRPEVPGRTHNTMSARERKARRAQERAKPTGNRGSDTRQRTA